MAIRRGREGGRKAWAALYLVSLLSAIRRRQGPTHGLPVVGDGAMHSHILDGAGGCTRRDIVESCDFPSVAQCPDLESKTNMQIPRVVPCEGYQLPEHIYQQSQPRPEVGHVNVR